MAEHQYLGVIPARGGSKAIPRKNIKMIAGKPLIVWTIEAARQSKKMDRFVVSTDDEEIAEISKQAGSEVMMRPAELASDTATTLSVLQNILTHVSAQAIVLLQPTSPVRSAGLIDKCITKFESENFDNVATGFENLLLEYGAYTARRQELKGFFHDDGNLYVIKSELIKQGSMFGNKVGHIYTEKEETFEIDDEFDFLLNEQILKGKFSAKGNT